MKAERESIKKSTTVSIETKLETADIEKLLRHHFGTTLIGMEVVSILIEVPRGGDYSGMSIEPEDFVVHAKFKQETVA